MPENNRPTRLDMLEAIMEVTAHADESSKWLESLANNPAFDPVSRAKFVTAHTALVAQSHIIRRMTEHQMFLEESFEEIGKKLDEFNNE